MGHKAVFGWFDKMLDLGVYVFELFGFLNSTNDLGIDRCSERN